MAQDLTRGGLRGLPRIVNAARCAALGLAATFRYEEAFRQEVFLFVLLAPLGLWLGENGFERALLLGSLLSVLIAELLNTAVEVVVDRVGVERHVLSGRAKDIASAAVMIALLNAVATWVLVLVDF